MAGNVPTFVLATVILSTIGMTAHAQPMLVTEIPTASTNFHTAGELVYFTSRDSLLRSDGTDAGTIFLRSGFTTALSQFTDFNGMLFFTSGNQLWRSDGTPGGTIQLTTKSELDILSGTGTALFFQGSDAATGQELYKTNGTPAGTALVKDINPGPGDGFLGNSAVVGDNLFFRGNNGVSGDEPWKSNGTAAGTMMIEDINPGSGNGFVHGSPYDHGDVYAYNNFFYFSGNTTENGQEPWVSDGTAPGTFILSDIHSGVVDPSWILWGIGYEGTVYLIVQPKYAGSENTENTAVLWKTRGTTASTVALGRLRTDYYGEIEYRDPFRVYKEKIYFFAREPWDGPHYLWVSDGTPFGTYEVAGINDYRTAATFSFFDVVGDYMLFNGSADGNPSPLYRSDGTAAGTGQWYTFNSGAQFTRPTELTVVSDLLFYADHDGQGDEGGFAVDPDDYFHLFQNDGETWQSMRTMYGVSTIGTDNIVDYNGTVAFTTQNGQDGSTDRQKYLWIYDPVNSSPIVGRIKQELWNGVPGTKVSDIPVDEPPSSVRELTLFETPSNIGDNYGSRVRGFVVPPSTDYYTFWIASDDQGELWLSTDMDPANKGKIAEVSGWTNPRQWDKYPSQKSERILLEGGQKYYIEALFKEGSGGDHLAVGWLFNRIPERPIPGNRLMPYEENASPIITITSPDEGEVFPPYADITITADASDDDGTITEVEFYDGAFFLGEDETAPYSFTLEKAYPKNYTLVTMATDNDGGISTDTVRISVREGLACEGAGMIRQEFWTGVPGTRVSDIPVNEQPDFTQDLTIFEGPASAVGDNYGSRIRGYICPPATGSYIFWIAGDDQVELSLSTDDNPANKRRIAYHTGWTNKREWTKYATQQSASITLQAGQRYYIEALMKEGAKADHVSVGWQQPDGTMERPIAGSHLIPFGASDPDPDPACAGTGTISVETWTGIDGTRVSSIPVDSPPDLTGEQNIFEAPTNIGSNFGSRFRGYVCVPTNGNYTFWIASDDHSELWLSSDADPANKGRIAYHTGWTSPRQWTKYATQQSAPIALVAGQQYYIEALYKEDEGGDNMAVGWQLPDGTLERPIPGNRLSPFNHASSTTAARMTTEQDLYSRINVYPNPVQSGESKLTLSGYEDIEKIIETHVEIINMTGETVFAERLSCGGDCSSYLMNINKQLVPGVYVVKIETDGVRSAKRLLVK